MSNYLYNGIELPALPEWDKETYPYSVIVHGMLHELHVSKEPFTCGTFPGYGLLIVLPAGHIKSIVDLSNAVWGSFTTINYENQTSAVAVWSNHDIINTDDGSVYLKASDPVPVLTLTERDLYRKINGQPVKLTLYKKVGGELVPLDEYTQGGNL